MRENERRKQILTKSQEVECFDADRFYDESGEFTYKGITGQKWYSVVSWLYSLKSCGSNMVPKLNKKGNSELGMHALELLTKKLECRFFKSCSIRYFDIYINKY
jgi:glutaminase